MKKTDLDRTDWAILDQLAKDGRTSNKVLAHAVNLAPSTCSERLHRLRKTRVIKGIHADVDFPAIGYPVRAMYMLRLSKHERAILDSFHKAIVAIPEVRSVSLVTGHFDFLVQVTVKNSEHLRDLALDHITCRPEVESIETFLVYDHEDNHMIPMVSE